MDIEMFGQLLPEQANAPDSATTYGFTESVTDTLPPLLSHQLIPNLGHAIKGPIDDAGVAPRVPIPFLGIGLDRKNLARTPFGAPDLTKVFRDRGGWDVRSPVGGLS